MIFIIVWYEISDKLYKHNCRSERLVMLLIKPTDIFWLSLCLYLSLPLSLWNRTYGVCVWTYNVNSSPSIQCTSARHTMVDRVCGKICGYITDWSKFRPAIIIIHRFGSVTEFNFQFETIKKFSDSLFQDWCTFWWYAIERSNVNAF